MTKHPDGCCALCERHLDFEHVFADDVRRCEAVIAICAKRREEWAKES